MSSNLLTFSQSFSLSRCASPRSEVEATAFVHPEGDTAVIASNRHGHGVAMRLVIDGVPWAIDLPPHSLSTFVFSE